MRARTTKKKVKKGRKSYAELGKKKFDRILRNKIKELNGTLKFKYDFPMCICEIGIGNTTRINPKGNSRTILFMFSVTIVSNNLVRLQERGFKRLMIYFFITIRLKI